MAKPNPKELLKQYEFLDQNRPSFVDFCSTGCNKEVTPSFKYLSPVGGIEIKGIIKQHEAKKETKLMAPISQQSSNTSFPQNSHTKHSYVHYKPNVNRPFSSFNQKPPLHKPNAFGIPHKNNMVLINKPTASKYVLQNNKNSNVSHVKESNSNTNVYVQNTSSASGSKNLLTETNSETSSSWEKINKGKLLEEIESLTELMKIKTSQNKFSNAASTNENRVQSKLSGTFDNSNSFNKYKTVNGSNVFSKTKSLENISLKKVPGNVSQLNKGESQCTAKLEPVSTKNSNFNKYCFKKPCSKIIEKPSSIVEQSIPQKRLIEFSGNKTNFLESKSVQNKLHLIPDKQNLSINLNISKDSVSLDNKLNSRSISIAKVKAPVQLSVKASSMYISKLKSSGSRYVKVNKHLIIPKTNSLKRVISPKSIKKMNRKVNTKYKVINKHGIPPNKKFLSSVRNKGLIAVDESDSFFEKVNQPAMDKLEKDLLIISSVYTASPLSSKVGCDKERNSITKVNPKLSSNKMTLKKSKATRISKYKIVNSRNLQSCLPEKKQNTAFSKAQVKKLSCSKYKLVNRNLRPLQILTPQGKPVLVKRLFKSKNALVNKNASPTNFSAKMIKSKYLALNKRRYPLWQQNCRYTKVPFQNGGLKGYYLKTKLPLQNGQFQKITGRKIGLSWKGTGKFSNYHRQALSRQFRKNSCIRKLKNGYGCSPVVFIRGMKYSVNSSGKTLKKLPTPRGHTTKIVRKTTFWGKTTMKTPENLIKSSMPSSNLANRVLYRSINRILSASIKKSLTKVNTYCMFYNRFGRCNNGVKCTYIHDPSKIAVCTRFLRGTCKVDGCPFSHEIAPGKMAHCSFFLVGACEKANCPYRHEKLLPDAELCKAFVQGYCPKGKTCKKAHILVCPKYIQGECDKGNSCAFPHPPRKVKKNGEKNEEEVEKKPDDVLMETVARYFQTENSSSLSCENKSHECVVRQYVPKRRKLEEQPSFIPLFDTPKMSTNELESTQNFR